MEEKEVFRRIAEIGQDFKFRDTEKAFEIVKVIGQLLERGIFCNAEVKKALKEKDISKDKKQIQIIIDKLKKYRVFVDADKKEIIEIMNKEKRTRKHFKIGQRHYYKINLENDLFFLYSQLSEPVQEFFHIKKFLEKVEFLIFAKKYNIYDRFPSAKN